MSRDIKLDFRHLYNHGRRLGLSHQEAEDFAQEASLKIHLGRIPKFEWLLADFLRQTRGSSRSKTGLLKQSLDGSLRRGQMEDDPEQSIEALADVQLVSVPKLSRWERAIVVLHAKWGLTFAEIGEVFGLTEAGVSFITRKIRKRINPDLD